MDADVIIIGSGFAGAVAAARLVDAGLKVAVIERGPWRKTQPVEAAGIIDVVPLPRAGNKPFLTIRDIRMMSGPKQFLLNKRGLLEFHIGKGMRTLASSSVGGGSHIWGGVVSRPVAVDYWDKITSSLSEDLLQPHFSKIIEELGAIRPENAKDIPNYTSFAWKDRPYLVPVPESEQYLQALLLPEKYGGPPATHNRSPSTLDGNDGTFGSVNGAKASVDAIYLIPRLGANLEVNDLHEVESITGSDQLYEIATRDHKQKTNKVFKAKHVILAAGTMNTVKLLCTSEDAGQLRPMPALGKGFGTNGDCAGIWEPGGDVDSTVGINAFGRLYIKDVDEDGFNINLGGVERPPLPSWLPDFLAKKANAVGHQYQVIGMGADRADGRIRFHKGRLKLDYKADNSAVYKKIFAAFERLSDLSGKPVKYKPDDIFTCHPMGGCRISDSDQDGVVNSFGESHNNPGLFITDASVFTAPTGSPPTLNITAWSSYVAENLIKRIRG